VFDYLTYTLCYIHNGDASIQEYKLVLRFLVIYEASSTDKFKVHIFWLFIFIPNKNTSD